jgi:prepilin signal peptidase PulO-like enzyme (type II secretory pathway)
VLNWISGTPGAAQAVVVFLFGTILASAANYVVDRCGWTPRYRSPWRRFPTGVVGPKRRWTARIPVVGWLETARLRCGKASGGAKNKAAFDFAALPGWENRLFWLRAMVVEALFATLLAWRFYALTDGVSGAETGRALVFWGAETVLYWLALCMTLVDFDDYIIPDAVVIPGAVVGLTLAAVFPFLTVAPIAWPLDLSGAASTNDVFLFAAVLGEALGFGSSSGVVCGFVFGGIAAIWTFWNFALLERRFPARRLGVRKAAAIFGRRLRRSPLTPILAAVWAAGLVGIAVVVFGDASAGTFAEIEPTGNAFLGRTAFDRALSASGALANAAVGLFVGATIIWAVRIIGRSALGVEAMGFGDVAALGVIGAFVGWEGAVVAFFVAPFFGLLFGFLRRFSDNSPEIPYGPFLCGGAVVYLARREQFSAYLEPFFNDPLFLVGLSVVGFALLWGLLAALRWAKSRALRG